MKAVDLAAQLVEIIAEQEEIARTHPTAAYWCHNVIEQWVVTATEASNGMFFKGPAVTPPTDGHWDRQAHHIGHDAAVRALWSKHRIVYDVDPSLWAELADTDDDTVIPDGLMRRLPHPDPFIAFPAPIFIPSVPGEVLSVEGFFVNGRHVMELGPSMGRSMVSTHSGNSSGDLGLLFVGRCLEADTLEPKVRTDGGPDFILTRVTMHTGRGETTVGRMIDATAENFDAIAYGPGFDSVPPLMRAATGILVYLCSANADVAPARKVGRPPQRRAMGGKAELVDVGFYVGAAIRQAEEDVRRAGGSTVRVSGAGRASVRPHIRRAHFHRYRIGQGRREVTVKWLEPIPVNVTPGGATVPTVHPVR